MELIEYDEKHVRVLDIYGRTHEGVADYFGEEYMYHEYGEEEEAIIVRGFIIYRSQIASIEEMEVHGSAELRTDRLKLRRYIPEDAPYLYKEFGQDPDFWKFSGWNPYATQEMAEETVRRFIESCQSTDAYSWVMDSDDVLLGTIGAYDRNEDTIEVGCSVKKRCWGRGYATEALKKVLWYLTENEGIPCVTAWCAADNIGSKKVLEKAGMQYVRTEKDGLKVEDRVFDRMIFEYRRQG